jgi:hypothetical protein
MALTFTTEIWDTDSFHDNSTNNSRITIPTGKSGKYLVSGMVQPTQFNWGYCYLYIYLNGTKLTNSNGFVGDSGIWGNGGVNRSAQNITLNLTAGDYIEIFVQGDNGTASQQIARSFQVTYLGA